MTSKVTITDVARMAGVSVGTVYRAVNNSGRIKEETRKLVMETVKRLGYKANETARGLALRNKISIIAIIPNMYKNFWMDVINGIRQAATELLDFGVKIIEFIHEDGTVDGENIMEVIKKKRVDAILLSIVGLEESGSLIQYASEHQIPIAVINEDTASKNRLVFYGPDNHRAGRMAAEMMIKFCGNKGTCCMITSTNAYIGQTIYREEAFKQYILEYGRGIGFAGIKRVSPGEIPLFIQQVLKEKTEIKGFYIVQYEMLMRICQLLDNNSDKYTIIGHEYDPSLREPLRNGTITALLVQEKFCQGYYPIRMLYRYLVTGEKPEKDSYYSNVNIMIGENVDYIMHNQYGCGYR